MYVNECSPSNVFLNINYFYFSLLFVHGLKVFDDDDDDEFPRLVFVITGESI